MIGKRRNKIMRERGYYWCKGNSCYGADDVRWRILFWDGHWFWEEGDDFSEDVFIEINENRLLPPE